MKLVAMVMAGVISLTSVTSALANTEMYSVMIKFNDGVTRQYNKVPADTPIEVLAGRIQKDFPNKSLTDIVEANSWPQQPQQTATPMPAQFQSNPETPKEGLTWGKVAWAVGGAVLLVLVGGAIAKGGGSAGGCANTWDTAKDGSRCGNRAASVRPGGR
jgi:hypothetical protein